MSQEVDRSRTYNFPRSIIYSQEFVDSVRGIPQGEIDRAFDNSLIANRILEEAKIGMALERFAKNHGIPGAAEAIRPDFGFVRGADTLHSVNMLTLRWLEEANFLGESRHQIMSVIIDAKLISGFYGANIGEETSVRGVYATAMRFALPLPVIALGTEVLANDIAHTVGSLGFRTLDTAYRGIMAMKNVEAQASFLGRNLAACVQPSEVA